MLNVRTTFEAVPVLAARRRRLGSSNYQHARLTIHDIINTKQILSPLPETPSRLCLVRCRSDEEREQARQLRKHWLFYGVERSAGPCTPRDAFDGDDRPADGECDEGGVGDGHGDRPSPGVYISDSPLSRVLTGLTGGLFTSAAEPTFVFPHAVSGQGRIRGQGQDQDRDPNPHQNQQREQDQPRPEASRHSTSTTNIPQLTFAPHSYSLVRSASSIELRDPHKTDQSRSEPRNSPSQPSTPPSHPRPASALPPNFSRPFSVTSTPRTPVSASAHWRPSMTGLVAVRKDPCCGRCGQFFCFCRYRASSRPADVLCEEEGAEGDEGLDEETREDVERHRARALAQLSGD